MQNVDSAAGESVAGRAAAERGRVWVEEPNRFTTARISTFRHSFHHHPLMQLPQLHALAKRLFASGQCRFLSPGISRQSSAFLHQPSSPDGRDVDEVFRRIEEPGAWIALYNVESDALYREFLAEVQLAVKPFVEREQPGIFNVGGFVFISAPPSVTPFHIDRENNFWLQIRGQKTVNVWDHTDRDVVAARNVEEFILYGSLERVRLKEELRSRSHELQTRPGDGIFFPATSPHMTHSSVDWVKPGNGVSISIGTVFYSDVTRRHARVHQLNQVLRRFGLNPRAPGESAVLDAVKAPLGRAVAVARNRWRGSTSPPPGSY